MKIGLLLPALLIGALGGIASPLFGVGGGVVMVPGFQSVLGMPYKTAVGTSLAVIVVTALVASYKFGKGGLIDFRIAAIAAAGSVVATWLAADWMQKQSSAMLVRLFAVFMIVLGCYFLWRSFRVPAV
ncbi:MAG: sulfite exporter TauE/SafE family protein [Verrucomicrobiota bacterium]